MYKLLLLAIYRQCIMKVHSFKVDAILPFYFFIIGIMVDVQNSRA